MFLRLSRSKFLILKLHNGLLVMLYRGLGMVRGFMKKTYIFMVDLNCRVQLFPLIPSLKSIYRTCLKIILICITK
jgi:hypothetical protein